MFNVGDHIVYPMHRGWSNRCNRRKGNIRWKANLLHIKNAWRGKSNGSYQ